MNMNPDTALDYAAFQLSPKRSRCELLVSRNGYTEKLASGLVKPFATHLKVVEEQVVVAVQSIKLQVERRRNAESWFTKGTLERFVRFVSTPEILELVTTFDAEMSQLEAARRIYSQGASDQLSGTVGGVGAGSTAADETKKELLRAIDVRLVAVKQDLSAACARAAAAGFNHGTISDLQMFAEMFGANRLNEACSKLLSLYERRPDLFITNSPVPWNPGPGDQALRSSCGSDMSIDDDADQLDLPKPTIPCPQPKFSSSASFPVRRSRESSIDKDDSKEVEKKDEIFTSDEPPVQSCSQPSVRRLSVQDRIKMFENKQETSGGSGGKPAVSKPAELRRLSSDVSSAHGAVDRAVLRRWSGVSDMSISVDLSGERKDFDSPLCTPKPSCDTPTSMNHTEPKRDQTEITTTTSTTKVVTSYGTQLTNVSLGNGEEDSLKIASTSQIQSRPISGGTGVRGEQFKLSEEQMFKESFDGDEHVVNKKQVVSAAQGIFLEGKASNQARFEAFTSRSCDFGPSTASYQPHNVELSDNEKSAGSKNESLSQLSVKGPVHLGHLENESRSRTREAFIDAKHKGGEVGSLPAQRKWSSPADTEEVGNKGLASSDKKFGNSSAMAVDSGHQRLTSQKQAFRDESSYVHSNNKMPFSKSAAGGQEGSSSMAPLDQVQKARLSKGNQELNDELKMKANELEKLFAEHKLRVPGDQSNSIRRSKPLEVDTEEMVNLPHRKQAVDASSDQFPEQNILVESFGVSSNMTKCTATSDAEMDDGQVYGDALMQNFSDLGFSDDSKGKFYNSYMKKRDARLREVWASKRAEKEAQMKAMHDSLERSRSEMNAKFSGSADRQDTVYTARRRAERLRSFNYRSAIERDQPLDFGQSEDDEDPSEFSEQKPFSQDKSFSESPFGNGVRSSQVKKPLPNRTSSTSTPRTSAAPVPRSASKASGSARRRMPSENPLAQSVPNFSDLRKENTKPYSAGNRSATRPHQRNYSRSKSANEEIAHVKEDKPRRSQLLRKSSATPAELKDAKPISSEGVVLTPLKFDKEQTEQSAFTKFPKESKPFLRKNNGIGPGAGTAIAKMKASMVSEAVNDEEEDEHLAYDPVFPADIVKDEDGDEEFDVSETADQAAAAQTAPRLSQESEKLMNSESENGDASQSFSQVHPTLVPEMPASAASTFHLIGSAHGSPGESPISWNSRTHHQFSYPQEVSDIDASADSPLGSPASWNLLNQSDADARMRKKWGSAQKPIIVGSSSSSQSRKDMTRGFKRLLKFGRKSRGTDSLVDWISATTSEGDDDTEDGRDLANRSSEDLRKSRMGFSHGDSFSESDYFSEQVQALHSSIPAPPANFRLREDHLIGSSIKAPRSFFSLSSFRSKGSESKPR